MMFFLILVFLLPGVAWLANRVKCTADTLSALADAAGLSIAVNSLLWLSSVYLNVKITEVVWLMFYCVCSVSLLRGVFMHRRQIRMSWKLVLSLTALFLITVFRFFQVRDLVFPAWVDSIQHATVINWLVSAQAVASPQGYLPFFYYFGFHGFAATTVILTGQPVDQVMLVLGQVIGALIPFAIYRLAKVLFGDFKRAFAAALLVAFFSHMPAYYASWGRYTLLTGAFLCILAMAHCLELMRKEASWGDAAMTAVLITGTWLAHYLAGIILMTFISILAIGTLVTDIRHHQISRGIWIKLIAGVAVGVLICLPWLMHAWQFARLEAGISLVRPSADENQGLLSYAIYLLRLAGPWRNYLFMGLGLAGLVGSFSRPKLRSISIWGLLLVIASLPFGLRLNPFRPDHLLILLWIPFSLSASFLLMNAVDMLGRLPQGVFLNKLMTVVLLGGLSTWGLISTSSIVNLNTILADKWDKDAIRWVGANLSKPVFLINLEPWQSGIYRGVDGGYWLGLLTDASINPALYLYTWQEPLIRDQTRHEIAQVVEFTTCNEGLYKYLDEHPITHIYIHIGTVGLQPAGLASCQAISSVYENGHVIIYQVDREQLAGIYSAGR
jgi:hypothetical protein